MMIPDVVRLNGVDYTVKFTTDLTENGMVLDGRIDHNHSLICINTSTQDYQHQCITFLHEICHAILQQYDCADKGTDARMPDNEEELAEMISRGFYQFLRDNERSLFDVENRFIKEPLMALNRRLYDAAMRKLQ